MEWWEFTMDNGDGSYSKKRYRTEEEARSALEWFEENVSWFCGDGDGVNKIDTEATWFFDTLEDDKANYGPLEKEEE
jgi:hypothetical protein